MKQNWTKNTAYREFSVKAKDSVLVALDTDEIMKIEQLSGLTGSRELSRKLFLVQIYTGLRLSDLKNLHKENFDFKKKEIKIYTVKTESYLIFFPITTPSNFFLAFLLTSVSTYFIKLDKIQGLISILVMKEIVCVFLNNQLFFFHLEYKHYY